MSFEVNDWIYDPEVASFLAVPAPGAFHLQGLNDTEVDQNPSSGLQLSIPGLNVSQDVSTYLKAAFFDKDPIFGLSSASASMAATMGNPLFPDVTSNNDQFDFTSFMNPYPSESIETPSSFFDCSYNLLSSYSDHFSPVEPSLSRSSSDTFSRPSPPQQLHSSELTSTIASSSSYGYVPPSGATQSSARRVAGQWSLPSFISASSQG